MHPDANQTVAAHKVLVWDLPSRVFHWSIVLLLPAAYITWRLNWLDWHVRIGYALLTLVIFRVLWGFLGSEPARFRRFVRGPVEALGHLAHMLRREPDRQMGHNPAGGWMVLALLFLLLAETLTGLYVSNDIADEGPLTEHVPAAVANAIMALHAWLWDALAAAAILHVLAIIAYQAIKGQNLWLPMLRGWKQLPLQLPQPRIVAISRALLLLLVSALAVAVLVNHV